MYLILYRWTASISFCFCKLEVRFLLANKFVFDMCAIEPARSSNHLLRDGQLVSLILWNELIW